MTYGKGGSVRAISMVAVVAGLAFLAACGGGTPAGVQVGITVTSSSASLIPGGKATITATVSNSSSQSVTWSISPAGFGTLSSTTTNPVTYTAPTSVPTATTVMITAAGSGATGSVQIAISSSAIGIALSPAAPQTVNQAGALAVTATLTNDTSNKGVSWTPPAAGSLTNVTTTSVTYVAPSNVAPSKTVTLKATSNADAKATAALEITVLPSGAGPNVAALSVNSGTAGVPNIAFTSVLICAPGSTTNCATVPYIQVDTGSEGLRILQSAIPTLALPVLTDTNGNTIFNCVQFLDTSYLWGPVQGADIKIAGEVAAQSLVQVVNSSNSGVAAACSNGGTINENTPALLGANGIIGVGLEPTDCTLAGSNFCDGSVVATPPSVYFSCPSSGCASGATAITVAASDQVVNPVVLFAVNNGVLDNNGVLIQLPALAGGAASLDGTLVFGINTQANNTIGNGADVFGLDTNDNFITIYSGQTLTGSFIDSGSNALFFPSAITVCADDSEFYCPASPTNQSAVNEGASGSPTSPTVDFSIDNADTLFAETSDFAFGTLGGPNGTYLSCPNGNNADCTFDSGLPFFFGRSVFTAIDGQNVSGVGAGPFWAY